MRFSLKSRTKYAAWICAALAVTFLPSNLLNGQTQGPTKPRAPTSDAQIKVAVELVQVPVTVTDPYGRIVTGLQKQNFRVFEDNVEQEVQNFSGEDVPVSIALVLDMSGSIGSKMPTIRTGAVDFLRNGNPEDEFLAVGFREKAEILSPFTSDPETLQSRMLYLTSHGMTALFDGVYLALGQMNTAHNPRRGIILISDGGENHSRHSEKDVYREFQEADTQFFTVGVFGGGQTREESEGPDLLHELADRSGGRDFNAGADSVPDIVQKIGEELRSEYMLTFRPADHPHDGKLHKIKVQLNVPKWFPPLNVYARTGYTAPKQ